MKITSNFKKSKVRPVRGDVFRMMTVDGREFFGKVLADDVDPTFFRIPHEPGDENRPSLWIVAVYQPTDSPDTRFQEFLVGPRVINKLGWVRGYFETIGNTMLSEYDRENSRFWVEFNEIFYEIDWAKPTATRISKPDSEWVSDLSTGNHLTLELDICLALGEPCED